jgi:hypothetical protein
MTLATLFSKITGPKTTRQVEVIDTLGPAHGSDRKVPAEQLSGAGVPLERLQRREESPRKNGRNAKHSSVGGGGNAPSLIGRGS